MQAAYNPVSGGALQPLPDIEDMSSQMGALGLTTSEESTTSGDGPRLEDVVPDHLILGNIMRQGRRLARPQGNSPMEDFRMDFRYLTVTNIVGPSWYDEWVDPTELVLISY